MVDSILVVDDFVDGREMVAEYLQFRGFTVLQAHGGAEAVEVARRSLPRIVLMDLSMPGVDGWEATRQLKSDAQTRRAMVIALTAHALHGDEQVALDAGCDGFIAKPFDLARLADALDRLMTEGRRALPGLAKVSQSAKRHKDVLAENCATDAGRTREGS
jgi:CheY-like chemotaxis protein